MTQSRCWEMWENFLRCEIFFSSFILFTAFIIGFESTSSHCHQRKSWNGISRLNWWITTSARFWVFLLNWWQSRRCNGEARCVLEALVHCCTANRKFEHQNFSIFQLTSHRWTVHRSLKSITASGVKSMILLTIYEVLKSLHGEDKIWEELNWERRWLWQIMILYCIWMIICEFLRDSQKWRWT